jgi:hypothetical protein
MSLREADFEKPHIETTLAEFIESMKDPNVIRAILDSTTGSVECPTTLVGCAPAFLFHFVSFRSLIGLATSTRAISRLTS